MSTMNNAHTLDLNSIRKIFGTTDPEKMMNMIHTSVVRELKAYKLYEIIMRDISKWHVVEYYYNENERVEISDGGEVIATLYQGRFFDEIKKHVEKNASIMSWF